MSTFMLLVIFLAVLAGALFTYRLWDNRGQPAVQRQLTKLWVGISLLTIILIGLTATSTGLFAWYLYHRLASELAESGFSTGLAKMFAALAALPMAIFATWAISLTEWKRNVGLAGLFLVVAACSYARYVHRDTTAFSAETGASLDGYTVLLDGYLKRCDTSFDRASGQPCLPITPVVQQFLADSEDSPQLFVDEPEAFFDPNPAGSTPEPIIWHCERGDGAFHFVRIPIRDPMTGKPCVPMTGEMAEQWHALHNAADEATPPETEAPSETTQEEAEVQTPSGPPPEPDLVDPRLPFLETFEDSDPGLIVFDEKWFLYTSEEETDLSAPRIMCAQHQGTFKLPFQFMLGKDRPDQTISFQLSSSADVRMYITYGTRDQWEPIRLAHNQIVGDAPPQSWVEGLPESPKSRTDVATPKTMEKGWKTVQLRRQTSLYWKIAEYNEKISASDAEWSVDRNEDRSHSASMTIDIFRPRAARGVHWAGKGWKRNIPPEPRWICRYKKWRLGGKVFNPAELGFANCDYRSEAATRYHNPNYYYIHSLMEVSVRLSWSPYNEKRKRPLHAFSLLYVLADTTLSRDGLTVEITDPSYGNICVDNIRVE